MIFSLEGNPLIISTYPSIANGMAFAFIEGNKGSSNLPTWTLIE
nr:MAG TPA: hypothetical protein [Caudoviricetes sp.]